MTELPGFKEFEGRSFETGPVRNGLAYQGAKAPHTGEPYSEALLMGVSGGAVMGYFSFARHRLFQERGQAALEEIREAVDRLNKIRALMKEDFPLDSAEAARFLESLAVKVEAVREVEGRAIEGLQDALA